MSGLTMRLRTTALSPASCVAMLPQKFSAATTRNFPCVPLDPPDGAADPLVDDLEVAAALEDDGVELPHALSATASISKSKGGRSDRRGIGRFLGRNSRLRADNRPAETTYHNKNESCSLYER